jgi:hypothetical protein
MSTSYEPNIQGAIAVLRDLMIANSFTLTREPYEPNYRGLVDAVIDLKEGFPTFSPLQVGFDATAFEDLSKGNALYMRTSDGQVGKASAADGTSEAATVVGFAGADAAINTSVKVIVVGLITLSSLDAGDLYFLSATTAGAKSLTPPSSAGQAVVRLGEAASTTEFAIQIEPPIKLS